MKFKKMEIRALVLCSFFAALIAVGAFIRIPIPVVPFTLQFLFTNLAGFLLGGRRGFIAVGLYILIGLVGVPVFSAGGGLGYIFQPTFGYIIGFALGTYVGGNLGDKLAENKTLSYVLAGLINLAIVYVIGLIYYYGIARFYLGKEISLWTLFLYGFLLAVPGDLVLCVVSGFLAKRLSPVLKFCTKAS